MSDESGNIDPALAQLVKTVDVIAQPGHEGAVVTLVINGRTVSGKMISEQRWITAVEDRYREAWVACGGPSDDGSGIWSILFREFKNNFFAVRTGYKVDDVGEGLPERYRRAFSRNWCPRYVHLRCAQGSPPDASQSADDTYWRGRLADVSGWSFGMLTVGTDNAVVSAA
jgi:hypothetical protein